MTRRYLLSALLMSVTALGGCGALIDNSADTIQGNMARSDTSMRHFENRPAIRAGGAQVSDGIFLGATAERRTDAARLPSELQVPDAVSLQSRDPMTLAQIAQRLSEITGLAHLVALGPAGTVVPEPQSFEVRGSDGEINQEQGSVPAARQTQERTSQNADRMTVRPSLKGPLSQVLDEIASSFSVEWGYRDNRIVFRDFVTRQYQVSSIPARTNATTSIGVREMQSNTSVNTDTWEEISTSLESIVSEEATISLGSGTGMVTVTAKIADHDRIADYFETLNEVVGKQVAFDINVLTVSSSDTEGYGVNLAGLLRTQSTGRHGGERSLRVIGNEALAGAVGSVNVGIIAGDLDLSTIVQALSQQGQVSVENRAGATTSNNRVVPITVTESLSFIKSQNIETDSNGNQTRSIKTDDIETGFQLQIFPRILNNREVMIQYTVNLSELRALQSFGDGIDTIQLPQVSETSFEQQAIINNGETLVLAGFERERTQLDNTGTSGPVSALLGIGRNASRERVSTVLMITPRILNRRAAGNRE